MIDRGEIQGELAAIRTSVGSLTFYEQSGHEQRLLEIADALLAELEQAERERDKVRDERDGARCDRDNFRASAQENARLRDLAEARLAKVVDVQAAQIQGGIDITAVLADWEQT